MRRLQLSFIFFLLMFVSEVHSWARIHSIQSLLRRALLLSRRQIVPSRFRFTTMSTSDDDQEDQEETDDGGEIIMLSGYPFYTKGPDPKAIEKVAARVEDTLERTCGDQLKGVSRMGSSAIAGIAGTPVCDMLAQIDPWPLADEAKERLAAAGYEFKGGAPHAPQDEWFFGGDGQPGHLGRVVLHTVPVGSDFCREMKAFVDYVNSHPDAFERYNNVKLQGAILMSKSDQEEGRLLGYKQQKEDVCKAIKQEAIEWYKKKANDAIHDDGS